MPGPFAASRPGCGAAVHASAKTGPTPCPSPPTWIGIVWFPYPKPGELCLGFACDGHLDHLDVARPLDDDGRTELARRRERDRLVVVEKQPVKKDPPLAIGSAALARLDRARSWARTRADEGWWVREDDSPGG